MGIGASLFLLALGAILAFALNFDATNINGMAIDWNTVGFILMAVGVVGLIWSLYLWAPRRTGVDRRDRVVERTYDDDTIV